MGTVEPFAAGNFYFNVTDEKGRERMSNRPPLEEILNLHDFEVLQMLTPNEKFIQLSTLGCCPSSHATKSMGILFFRSGR